MLWTLLLLAPLAYAQDDVNMKAIQDLDQELPHFERFKETEEETSFSRKSRGYSRPVKIVTMDRIKNSGTQPGAIPKGALVNRLKDNKSFKTTALIYVKVFNLEDENSFKYVQSKNGDVIWRVESRNVEPIKEELTLYVPPHKYTPAPDNIIRAEYDKKLSLPPEFSFYAGFVNGNYMADLFNDEKAKSGVSNQYGLHLFTDWKLPIKVGGVLHYERASYDLTGGSKLIYSSISFGPQIKSRDFELLSQPLRVQAQFRVSPFARATGETTTGNANFKFNSYDLLTSLERPIKNRFGEFVIGAYFQSQWLNIKDQPEVVSIKASNETNQSFGLSFAQVFQ